MNAANKDEHLLREAQERLRQRRAALGIVHPSQDQSRPSLLIPAEAVEFAELPCIRIEENHFTQDTQDTNDSLDAQDLNGHVEEAAGAACLGEEDEHLEIDQDKAAVPDLNLPLDRYVEEAGRAELAWMEEQSYDSTGSVEWKGGWHFVRLLKCHPELRDLKTLDALAKAKAAIVRASRRLPTYRTFPEVAFNEVIGEFLPDSIDEFDAHFIRNWKAIRYLPGESPLETAMRLANRYPLSTHEAKGEILPQYRRLVSLAGWLQYVVGNRNIFLPVHKLGPLLGCSARSISSYIHMAEEEEILERVESHSPKSRKAHEFRFRTECWRILTDGPP